MWLREFGLNKSPSLMTHHRCSSRSIAGWGFLLFLTSLVTAFAQPAFLTNGLVAFYPFNGDFHDQSGNGLSLVNYGGTLGADRFGTNNSALYMTNGATLSTTVALPLIGNMDRSVSLWVGPLAKTAAPYGRLMGWGSGNLGFTTLFFRSYKPNPFAMDSGGAVVSVAPGFNPQGSWTHLVWTYTTNLGLSTFYVNGVKRASTLESGAASTVLNTPSGPLIIGDVSQVGFPTNALFTGFVDEIRLYSRVLSDAEVKGVYSYETNPQPLKVRPATATAQVVNGFLVGATITDGGYGYTNAPGVSVVGSGGQGAILSTVVSNEVVVAINIDGAGKHYPSNTTLMIDPPPYPPTEAVGSASLTNDAVLAVSIVDGGHGYGTNPPPVSFVGSGSGAKATATVQNGVVTAIMVTSGGSGYTTAPTVVIGAPQALSSLTIATSQVRVDMDVSIGYSFQLQSSPDLKSWSNVGAAFLATTSPVSQSFNVENQGRYFRLVQVP